MKITENFHFLYGLFSANVGIIKNFGEIALIDSGFSLGSVDTIISYLELLGDFKEIKYLFLTHGDPDHIGGAKRIKDEYGAKVIIHKSEIQKLENHPSCIRPSQGDILIDKDMEFYVGKEKLELIVTPGHSSGSVCVYNRKHQVLFTGDTIVEPSFLLKKIPIESTRTIRLLPIRVGFDVYFNSLKKLSKIEIKWLLPGHGNPIRGGVHKKIKETISVVRNLKENVYKILNRKLAISDLASKLSAHELIIKAIIKQLLEEEKIQICGEKCLTKEYVYRVRKRN
jgi:glyoxylase-like metal-dependent hydrolase (beta-lactamase superfamily II)